MLERSIKIGVSDVAAKTYVLESGVDKVRIVVEELLGVGLHLLESFIHFQDLRHTGLSLLLCHVHKQDSWLKKTIAVLGGLQGIKSCKLLRRCYCTCPNSSGNLGFWVDMILKSLATSRKELCDCIVQSWNCVETLVLILKIGEQKASRQQSIPEIPSNKGHAVLRYLCCSCHSWVLLSDKEVPNLEDRRSGPTCNSAQASRSGQTSVVVRANQEIGVCFGERWE